MQQALPVSLPFPLSAVQAFVVADAMRKRGLQPTRITFNTLIDACSRSDNLTRAESTFEQMVSLGLQPNERTYSILINACARQVRPCTIAAR